LLAVVLGYFIGQAYNGTLFPMAFGFVSLITVSVLLTVLTETPEHPGDNHHSVG
jgi:hypothetical protein